MSYIEFDKEKLVNVNYSKSREILRCSRTGSFATTTLLGMNTRKYHGLFIVPQDQLDGERYLLLSNLNETLVVNDMEFHIGVNQYKGGVINPKGHKYLQKFVCDNLPTYYYRVGKFNFTKEFLFLPHEDRLIIKYSFIDDFETATMLFRPLLAFRQIHQLTHANSVANTDYTLLDNGVQYCMYERFTPLCVQTNLTPAYQHTPDWYYDFEYEEELKRGYEGYEDLYNPGILYVSMKEKELYVSIGTTPMDPQQIATVFEKEKQEKTHRSSYFNCLKNAAEQFIVNRNGKSYIIAGYPWFGRWGRDTFIALPGLTLALHKPELCKQILDDMLGEMQNGLFPNIGQGETAAYNSVDAPLWFVRALQQYANYTHSKRKIWAEYGEKIKQILNLYKKGTLYNIKMLENGLIYAGTPNHALTWMDAVVDGKPVTPRTGCQVEINALWYNALQFSLEVAQLENDETFIQEWISLVKNFPVVFKETFWSKEIGYLADYVDGEYRNFQVRPNMMIAVSLPYTPISEKIRQLVLKKVCEELLVEKGIRTLSPNDSNYRGKYEGTQAERDAAYHQGTAWPWLLAPFADGMMAVYGKQSLALLENILYRFDSCMTEYGISTISEVTDGNPPYNANGCISQAWSVAALLHIKAIMENNIY